jgi:hypothetical protein
MLEEDQGSRGQGDELVRLGTGELLASLGFDFVDEHLEFFGSVLALNSVGGVQRIPRTLEFGVK